MGSAWLERASASAEEFDELVTRIEEWDLCALPVKRNRAAPKGSPGMSETDRGYAAAYPELGMAELPVSADVVQVSGRTMIRVLAAPWVSASAVAGAYRHEQQRAQGRRRNRQVSARSLEVVQFVSARTDPGDALDWRVFRHLWKDWNEYHRGVDQFDSLESFTKAYRRSSTALRERWPTAAEA
jgi:hypothetical protein